MRKYTKVAYTYINYLNLYSIWILQSTFPLS